jgi:hypothetical protein
VDKVHNVMSNFERVNKEFKDFLFVNDKLAGFRIDYSLSYSAREGYYKIKIFPSKNNSNFNSRQYFIDNFENEKGLEKLAEFADKNSVSLITY